MRLLSRSTLLSTLAVLLLAVPAASQQSAPANDLGTLGGTRSSGSKINNNGAVIGYSTLPGDMSDLAFYHDGSTMQALTLGGTSSTASDLNDAGQVVGGSFTLDNAEYQAFYFHNGQIRMLSLGGTYGMAEAINEAGQVVGYSALAGDMEVHAFLYDSATDTMTDLQTLGGTYSYALDINEAGQVMGYSYITGDIASQGFRYSGGQMVALALTPEGSSWVNEMNASGQVVGGAVTAGGEIHGYVFDGVQTVDLGTLGGTVSDAVGINDAGIVIGNSRVAGDFNSVGFVFDGSSVQPLSLGGSHSIVVDINNAGQIAGEGYLPADTNYIAFLYQGGEYTPVSLGGTYTYAVGLNEQGDMMGGAMPAGSYSMFAFIYNVDGIQTISLGGTSSYAWDINENGDVAGDSWTAGDAEMHGYLTGAPADVTAPATAASTSSAPNGAGWFNADVTLNLVAIDDASGVGVREVNYSLDGGATFTSVAGSSASVPFGSDGVHAVQFFAVDNAGNQEAAQSYTIKLDKTAPAITVATNPTVLSPPNKKMRGVTVTGQITDNLSGIASASFRVEDEYGQIQPAGAVNVDSAGNYTVKLSLMADRNSKDPDGRIYRIFVRGTDRAGNMAESSATVTVPR